ncbi:hypothetical protein MFLO_08107 [Listeria floridensis FSL S10-1187]|uniref:Secreted protein n=1 Tax=Listeria floridensis FSL S10-1187 TaxID=1265817 RepID=A0ABP3AXW4_9LIST|nr:hypothetical protein [Listeria floridensis]EUJ31759.1 hypothetical protein MFLO_08107 [Listeria floridensis FSL S10-1187]
MTVVIIILLVAAIALFVLSFMQKGDNKQLETELEEVASQLMHENYELKKRVSALEKLMNPENGQTTDLPAETEESTDLSPKMKDLLKKQVITLYTTGIATDEIVEQIALPREEVEQIIEEYLEH